MKRLVGFSSGALAYSDFRRGVAMLLANNIRAIELSALRENELEPMISGIPNSIYRSSSIFPSTRLVHSRLKPKR